MKYVRTSTEYETLLQNSCIHKKFSNEFPYANSDCLWKGFRRLFQDNRIIVTADKNLDLSDFVKNLHIIND